MSDIHDPTPIPSDGAPPSGPVTFRRKRLALLVAILVALLAVALWPGRREGPEDWFQQGLAAFQQNDLSEVQRQAEALGELPDYQPHAHLLQGMVWLRNGRIGKALDQFGFAIEHPDTSTLAFALSGEALYRVRDYRAAEKLLLAALELDPTLVDSRRWLAAAYYDIGAMDDALTQLSHVAELDPDDPRPYRLRGLIFKDFEKYEEAIAEYRQSLQRNGQQQPDGQEILVEMAECLAKLRRYDEALQVLGDCRPSANVLTLQAECHYGQGQAAEAEQLLQQALMSEPHQLAALQLQATMALEARDGEQAAGILELARQHHPKDFTVRFKLMQAYRLLGKPSEAEQENREMERLRELRDQFTRLHEEAIADASSAELRYQLGTLAQQLDKPDLAQSWFLAALALDPAHQQAHQSLQALLGQDGR